MTIDEHIEYIKSQKECERLNSCDECDSQSCFSAEQIKLLEELRGYREQDLIRREDVNYIFYDEPILDTAGTCYGLRPPSRAMLQERILRIPKAEPFKENNL